MTKHGGYVHAPVILSGYTKATNSESGFVRSTYECMTETYETYEREDSHALGIWILALAAIVLDRDRSVLLLGSELLVRSQRSVPDFIPT